MTTVLLLRHARSAANGAGTLAGRAEGVGLDATGVDQAAQLPARLSEMSLSAIVTSPLRRCQDTVAGLATNQGLNPVVEPDLTEVDYGSWTGRELAELADEPLWNVVQQHPSAAQFPGGEALATVYARAVAAVRGQDSRIRAEHGEDAVWLLCSHGDVIKTVLADALGLHLDGFQRIVVEPCSLSVVRYTDTHTVVLKTNDTGNLRGIAPSHGSEHGSPSVQDSAVGGTPGHA